MLDHASYVPGSPGHPAPCLLRGWQPCSLKRKGWATSRVIYVAARAPASATNIRFCVMPNSGYRIRTYLCAGLHITAVTIINSATRPSANADALNEGAIIAVLGCLAAAMSAWESRKKFRKIDQAATASGGLTSTRDSTVGQVVYLSRRGLAISGRQLAHDLLRRVLLPRSHVDVEPSRPQRGLQDSQTTWIKEHRQQRLLHRHSRMDIYRPAGPGRSYPHQRGRRRRAPGRGSSRRLRRPPRR